MKTPTPSSTMRITGKTTDSVKAHYQAQAIMDKYMARIDAEYDAILNILKEFPLSLSELNLLELAGVGAYELCPVDPNYL